MEILAGGEIKNAFDNFGIKATRTYHWTNPASENDVTFEIWEITAPDLKVLGDFPNDEWKPEWGWFRYSEGTVLENDGTTRKAKINGVELDVFTNDHWCASVRTFIDDKEIAEEMIKEREKAEYKDVLSYLLQEFNVTSETNIAAITCGLAKINNMTMAGLWKLCQGESED